MPQPRYFDARGTQLPADAAVKDTAYTVYEIKIKRGVKYQPHPAFARNAGGEFSYHDLSARDLAGKTVLAASDREITSKSQKTATAQKVGELIAQKAKTAGITQVVFDRAGYRYHGRVKAVADGARSGGLEF